MNDYRRVAVKLPAFATKRELWQLQAIAERESLTISELIREAIEPLLKRERMAAGSQGVSELPREELRA